MRSRIRRSALAAALILVAACGGSRGADEGNVLTWVTWKPNLPAAWDEAVARFEAANPGVRVKRQIGPHSSTAFHDLLTQKLKNRDPDVDVFLMDVIWPAEFAAAGWALDLGPFFAAGERAQFLPGTIAANTWRGGIYGIPAFVDAGLLYYRSDLLTEYGVAPPQTWDDLVAGARTIIVGERRQGREIAGYSAQLKQYEGLVCNMLEIVVGAGGHLVDPGSGRAALSSPAALAAVRWARRDLLDALAPRSVLTFEEPESLGLFIQGRVVFHRNWPYAWGVANDPERSRVAGRVGVTLVPHFPGQASVATLGGWQFGISAFSRRRELAWRFVAFMTSLETEKLIAVKAFRAPPREALYGDADVLAANPQFARFAVAFRAAVPRPISPVYPAISSVLQRYFSQALVLDAADLQAYAREADDEIDRYLELVP